MLLNGTTQLKQLLLYITSQYQSRLVSGSLSLKSENILLIRLRLETDTDAINFFLRRESITNIIVALNVTYS